MTLIKPAEGPVIEGISRLAFCNPFVPERIELEKQILGSSYIDEGPVWSRQGASAEDRENLRRIAERAIELAESLRGRLEQGAQASDPEIAAYLSVAMYALYQPCRGPLNDMVNRSVQDGVPIRKVACWDAFLGQWERSFQVGNRDLMPGVDPAHLFACFYQLVRAFYSIYRFIIGESMPSARLRSAVWQSVFTHDMRRYFGGLFERLGDIATLVTGPSGTGKELVARAVGFSRYIPFDPTAKTFTEDFASLFHPLNLSAMSPTLIESELFGHKRGAFTGATADRVGWLETCSPMGSVFLDEIGELDPAIQVKLLRVLQARRFSRLGETSERDFVGKIIVATNRNLAEEMAAGQFRQDLYYRLCSDIITTPALHEQVADTPEDLWRLTRFIAARVVGDEAEAVSAEVQEWIENELGMDYRWPGNIRELEQCVRNVVIRKEYRPAVAASAPAAEGVRAEIGREIAGGGLSADEVLNRYCTLVMADSASFVEAAKRLGLDRRTVKARVDNDLLERLQDDR